MGPIHERSQTAVARATSQTVCDRRRTCDTTYSRNVSQNLRPVARAIIYATSYSCTLLRPIHPSGTVANVKEVSFNCL